MAAKNDTPRDPVRRWTLIILAAIVALYLYSIIADRMTPYTSQATVQAFIVRMAPEVSGRVQEVPVSDNQKVKAGDILFRIDPQTYEIALKQADARLANVGQTIGANTAAVASAQERLIEAKAKREHVTEQSNRTLELVKKGVYSEAQEGSGPQGNRRRRGKRARGGLGAGACASGTRPAGKRKSAISRSPGCRRASQAQSCPNDGHRSLRWRHHQFAACRR